MNPHLLAKCMYASLFEEDQRLQMTRRMLCNKKMAERFNQRCIGLATKDYDKLHKIDFLVSDKHPLLLKNIVGLDAKKKAVGLREKYIKKHIVQLEKKGFYPLVKANFDLESVVPFVDGAVRIMVNSANKIIIPYILTYQGWRDVAKATYPDEFGGTSHQGRLRMIFKTIRHSIGVYDAAWKQLPETCYGYICRRLVQMVCKHFPQLDNVAKSWLEQKSKVTDVDQFTLNSDWIVGSDKFYWLPDTLD